MAAVAAVAAGLLALAAPAASSRGHGAAKRHAPSRDWAYALAIQRDGKVAAAGRSIDGGWRFALARYTARGKLDRSFGQAGKVRTAFGSTSQASALAIQRDGKLVAAGRTSVAGIHDDFAVSRYTALGHLDSSFGRGGRVQTDFGLSKRTSDVASALAIQADGKLVVAGVSGGPVRGPSRFALARYTARGKLDPTFGRGGKVLSRPDGGALAVAIQRDGKIVAAGSRSAGFAVARYTARGKLDPTFGGGTVVTKFGPSSAADALAIQKDGKLVAVGAADFSDFGVARYTASGKLDSSFGSGGKVVTNIGFLRSGEQRYESRDRALAVAIQPDGKLVVAGSSDALSKEVQDFALVRYTVDGSLDSSFGDDGKLLTHFFGNASAEGVAIQADGKIVAAGGGAGYFVLARYTARGQLDPTFGSGGKVMTKLSPG